MHCKHCGTQAGEQDSFCRNCGGAVTRADGDPPAADTTPARLPHARTVGIRARDPNDVRRGDRPPSWSGSGLPAGVHWKTSETVVGEYELAGFGVRLGGFLLDAFVWAVASLILLILIGVFVDETSSTYSESVANVFLALLFLLWLVVIPGAQWTFNTIGWSVGKRAVGLRIIGDDGRAPGAGSGFGRTIGAILSGLAFGLGYLWAAWDDRNQTWHDKMASTYVVRAR